jgi:hypothetical protein
VAKSPVFEETMPKALVLTDPRYEPHTHGALARLALRWVNDERDLPFLRVLLTSGLVLGAGAIYLYWPGNFRWWIGALYLAINIGLFLPPYTLLLHNVSHRPLFKREYQGMRRIVPWMWGPLFGQTPESYYLHHLAMHHVEGNMPEDASSTLPYQRDSFVGFLHYWGRFFLIGLWDLGRYFWVRKRYRFAKRLIAGEVVYLAALAALLAVNWRATLVVFVIPLVLIRFLMLAGNWGQHAFIDARDPSNSYWNSITCINSGYNRRCFNDGYHIGHHIEMTRHWTDMPADFERNIPEYVRHDAIVFEGIDFFGVWACLMLKRYDWLARRYVDLGDSGRSQDEIIALLKKRTRLFPLPHPETVSLPAT